jgi:hypothetical protein
MIEICCICGTNVGVVPGPRNQKKKGFCGSTSCTIKGLLALAEHGHLERHEADDLNRLLGVGK